MLIQNEAKVNDRSCILRCFFNDEETKKALQQVQKAINRCMMARQM